MNLSRAFTFAFDDPEWVSKLVIMAVLTVASALLMPVLLLGLLPLCVLLGYLVELVNRMRDGERYPLPPWDDYGNLLSRGSGVLLGLVVYNLPLILMGLCIAFVPGSLADRALNTFVTLFAFCCVLPFTLIYLAVTWPMLAVGVARYGRGSSASVFFQAGRLFSTVNDMGALSIQWLLCVLIVNLVLIALLVIPCLGWAASLALGFPLLGHLLGQYARLIDNREKKRRQARTGPDRPRRS
jgi:uncharacterized protein involved in cysteine biosynthesis